MISLITSVRDRTVESKFKRVGLFATRTTIKTGLYKNAFENTGIEIVVPGKDVLDLCEKIIRGVIANKNISADAKLLLSKTENFIEGNKLDRVILGCTELPLAFPEKRPDLFIDCLDVLSDKLLNNYYLENKIA